MFAFRRGRPLQGGGEFSNHQADIDERNGVIDENWIARDSVAETINHLVLMGWVNGRFRELHAACPWMVLTASRAVASCCLPSQRRASRSSSSAGGPPSSCRTRISILPR